MPRVTAYTATLKQMRTNMFPFCTIASMLLGTSTILPSFAEGLAVPSSNQANEHLAPDRLGGSLSRVHLACWQIFVPTQLSQFDPNAQ